jgi:DNA replication protein DnaC
MPDLPVGHPDFGRAIPCDCKKQEMLERRLRAVASVGARDSVAHLTFDAFLPEGHGLPPEKAENLRRAYELCMRYAEEPTGWLLITGAYGCGKTHLAAAIANAAIERGQAALFLNAPDLLDHLRATFSPESEVSYDELFERLRNAPVLVLDDLGAQSSSSWAQEKLFQLLNHRYNLRLPTVITTNQRVEEMEPRLRSRLQDINLVTPLRITAPDFRMGGATGQGEFSSNALYPHMRFSTFDIHRPVASLNDKAILADVFEAANEFAREPVGWLLLSGETGTGKTHLAAAIASEQLNYGRTDVMFVSVPDLLDILRATYSPTSAASYDRRFDEIRRVPLLVLDDLGTESATPWAREKLFQLLNFRYTSRQLATVITTSIPLEKLDPWLRARVADPTRCKTFVMPKGTYLEAQGRQQRSGGNRAAPGPANRREPR